MRSRTCLVMLVAAAALAGCKKTDAELAARERAEIKARAESASLQVMLYRWVKTGIRSGAAGNEIPSVAKVTAALDQTKALPAEIRTVDDAAKATPVFLALAKALYSARKDLQEHDEDEFPLLWVSLSKDPLPAAWYDVPSEHLLLAWCIVGFALASKQAPAMDLVYYELSRAPAQPTWPRPVKLLGTGSRGLIFCQGGYHYAADEELTAYLADIGQVAKELDGMPVAERDALTLGSGRLRIDDPVQAVAVLQAMGYFARGWNRYGLDRRELAVEDLEQGLLAMERAGIENELTDWGHVVVNLEHGKLPEAAARLEKLAQSPYLDPKTQGELAQAAKDLREKGDAKGMLGFMVKAEGTWIVGKALVARAGGLKNVLVEMLGEERGARMWKELAWFESVRAGLQKVDAKVVMAEAGALAEKGKGVAEQGMAEAGELAEKGKGVAEQGMELLKGKVGEGIEKVKREAEKRTSPQ